MFSPRSLELVLSTLKLGARGETLKQISTILNNKNDVNHRDISNYTEIINHLFLDEQTRQYEINGTFIDELKDQYNCDIELIDFQQQAVVLEKVNLLIQGQTGNGFLKKYLPLNTTMLFINYVYFKAMWLFQFEKHDTSNNHEFYTDQDDIISNYTLMFVRRPFRYSDLTSELGAQIVHLPLINDYESSIEFVFTIVLPNRNVKLIDVLTKIMNRGQQRLLSFNSAPHHYKQIDLYLPKLSIKSFFDLKSYLIELGMKDAFDSNQADFSVITLRSERQLFLENVVHATMLNVNKVGIEEASLAFNTGPLPMCDMNPDVEFKCDRPFFFMINEIKTDAILFMGKYSLP
ncbi:unnamed protein product [Didymodactylos carnosus]|uniref:Serpin domain-containing protein n=1 Tax=Didymodactylos carnosus TaxID=1234261 RepID=A0A8S2DNY2_9BILA|nr:unnamed protein product [Didymodactylos carnosus]CAF3713832.1 unnamed protein product [Didymodactylos carnosus]